MILPDSIYIISFALITISIFTLEYEHAIFNSAQS